MQNVSDSVVLPRGPKVTDASNPEHRTVPLAPDFEDLVRKNEPVPGAITSFESLPRDEVHAARRLTRASLAFCRKPQRLAASVSYGSCPSVKRAADRTSVRADVADRQWHWVCHRQPEHVRAERTSEWNAQPAPDGAQRAALESARIELLRVPADFSAPHKAWRRFGGPRRKRASPPAFQVKARLPQTAREPMCTRPRCVHCLSSRLTPRTPDDCSRGHHNEPEQLAICR